MESQVMIFDEPSSPCGEGRGAEPWTAAEVLPSFDRSPESRQVEGRGHQRHLHPPLLRARRRKRRMPRCSFNTPNTGSTHACRGR